MLIQTKVRKEITRKGKRETVHTRGGVARKAPLWGNQVIPRHKPQPDAKGAWIVKYPSGFRLIGGNKGKGNTLAEREVATFSQKATQKAIEYLTRFAHDNGYKVVGTRGVEKETQA